MLLASFIRNDEDVGVSTLERRANISRSPPRWVGLGWGQGGGVRGVAACQSVNTAVCPGPMKMRRLLGYKVLHL